MKKKTKADKFADYADAVKAINKGQPPRRHGAKDGSIPTHPVVPVTDQSEKEVVMLELLSKHVSKLLSLPKK